VLAVGAKLYLADQGVDQSAGELIAHSSAKPQPQVTPRINTGAQPLSISPAVLKADEIYIAEGVRQQMADIAAAYEENMRYPSYSTPLQESDWTELHPRAFISKAMPLANDESVSAELVFDRFIVSKNQALHGSLRVYAPAAHSDLAERIESARLELANGQSISFWPAQTEQNSADTQTLVFDINIPQSSLASLNQGEHVFVANLTFSDQEVAKVSAQVKLVDPVASVNDVGQSYVDGAHLMIPISLEIKESGYYRLQANLLDADTLKPISHLNHEFELDSGSDVNVELKVHASVLRAKGYAGPYVLKDIDLTRAPATPADQTAYGAMPSQAFSVQGFDLDAYSREEYQDPKAKQRLEFLQKMAGIN